MKVLLIIEQCNPEMASVPLVGYQFYQGIKNLVNVTLVTHSRNKNALEKKHPESDIVYIHESTFIEKYYHFAEYFSKVKGKTIWPLYQTLIYPVYAEFNRLVYEKFKDKILKGEYDIVHAITPMMPRYPVRVVDACQNTPFVIGPVNGGLPFPVGFKNVAHQEFAYFNFLRLVGRWLIPGYRKTYKKADRILAGSTYTASLIQDLFNIKDEQIELFSENGIAESFLKERNEPTEFKNKDTDQINLLFVGRLVPYKGADMLVEAISKLNQSIQQKISLRIVGDGSERKNLEKQVQELHLNQFIHFTGWVPQQETLEYYKTSDIFCFPSVREFGGAVVLEAMASGLPCIVVNNGGIGEYVTDLTGFRIEPLSRGYVIEQLKQHIEHLVTNKPLYQQMSVNAIERAQNFIWSTKAKEIVHTYHKLLTLEKVEHSPQFTVAITPIVQ